MLKLLHRRQFLHLSAGAAALPTVSRIARAQAYPTRPVRIVVGFPPAGASDISARLIGPWLSEHLGQPFLIENRAGASSNIATEAVVRAPSDGHTLLLATCINTINASLYDRLNFDFIRDMAPVARIAYTPLVVVVHPTVPAKNVPELIAYAKANPRKLNLASAGFGTPVHVAGELFKMRTGTDMVQVQYQGGAPAVADLVGGQVQVMFAVMSECIEHIKAGKLRALALTAATPSDALPNVPVLADFLPGFEAVFWTGVCTPKNTPLEIVTKLNMQISGAISDPAMKARFADLGTTVFPSGSPAQFAQFISEETQKWGNVVKTAGMKAE
jgi:tripartite-type tricarboxylate transporter receptor subunit TctC